MYLGFIMGWHMNDEGNSKFNWLTQKEVAEMLKMSESWLERQRWLKEGIPFIKMGGKVYYDQKDVLNWIKSRKFNK